MSSDLKKNVTIEIRLPDQVKSAFIAQCQLEDRTASGALRDLIDRHLAGELARPARRQSAAWRIAAAWMVGAVLGAGVAAPSLAQSARPPLPSFDQLDRDHDGVVSRSEYRAG